jgi:hypothetical protein
MKKLALIPFFILVFLFNPQRVFAQTFDATKAYSDYQYQLSIYEQDDSDFQNAKTFYLANPTLQLKESLRQKTLQMLEDRDQLMVVYLTALRMQILETNGFTDDQKNAIYAKIDPEVAWYQAHITNYLDTDTLTDLFNKSSESQSRYATNTTPIIDESLFDIGLSQEIGLRLAHQQIYTDLKNYINDQVAAGKLKLDPFNMWLNDTDSVLQELENNETTAATKIQGVYQSYGMASIYDGSIAILTSSIDPLTQLNNYLTEMDASIQNQMQ